MEQTYDDLIAFHGHSCPGLAMGYRMARAAMDFLSGARAADEELVAIVENNACGVDALQCITGCTFGKGNLIFRDYGKHVYTLYNRKTGKGVRVVFLDRGIPDEVKNDRARFIEWLLTTPEEQLVSVQEVAIKEPEQARIMKSVECSFCGEGVMETRVRDINGRAACIPCWEKYSEGRAGS